MKPLTDIKPVSSPIYQPAGRAKEYGEYALNIYTQCNHFCTYCYAKQMFERYHPGRKFGSDVQPRAGIVEAVKRQLLRGGFNGRIIHLCFTCDPYPRDVDTTPTREIIKLIKEAGAHVQILTKGGDRARRDFDLLDENDWFGVTLTCGRDDIRSSYEPNAAPNSERYSVLKEAFLHDISTWVSFEPVLDPFAVTEWLQHIGKVLPDTMFKIGKLNHVANKIDWKAFGLEAERICRENKWNYMIKEDLRKEMER